MPSISAAHELGTKQATPRRPFLPTEPTTAEAILEELAPIICDAFWQATDQTRDREAIEKAFHVLHTHQRSN